MCCVAQIARFHMIVDHDRRIVSVLPTGSSGGPT